MHLSHLTLETDKKIYIGTFASDTTGGGAETLCELRSRHSDFFVSKVLMQDEAFGSGRTQNVAPRAANKSADAVSMKHHGSKRDAATKAANDIPNIGPPANSRHAMFKDGTNRTTTTKNFHSSMRKQMRLSRHSPTTAQKGRPATTAKRRTAKFNLCACRSSR